MSPLKRPRKNAENVTREDLKGWNEIAHFLGQPLSVAQRWAKSGMPVAQKGRHITASVDQLTRWLGQESGLPTAAHLPTGEEDLSQYLKAGLAEARKSKGRKTGKRAA
jgi:hypothetical protein